MCYFFKFLEEMEANYDHLKIQKQLIKRVLRSTCNIQ